MDRTTGPTDGPTSRRRRWPWLLLVIPVGLVALVSAATFVYIHFIAPDADPPLAFSTVTTGTTTGDPGSTTSTAAAAPGGSGLDGTWKATTGSVAGYRVHETLFGQGNDATGRTDAVTGEVIISGTKATVAKITVDMTKVSSDERQRDFQFQNRIMNTSEFPTATFELTSPIDFSSIPGDLQVVNLKATGMLTLHGTTKEVTIDLAARRNGANIELNGSVPITFSDYGVDNPSGGPASVGDDGSMEYLVILTKA